MTVTIKSIITILTITLVAAADAKTPVVNIAADNAAGVIPKALMLSHCARFGYGAGECNAKDFSGSAIDLNGNGLPEFSIVNPVIEQQGRNCTLYYDSKGKFAMIQNDFPCKIALTGGKTKGWADVFGVVYPVKCEPLKCSYTWIGASYKQGSCTPATDGECGAE